MATPSHICLACDPFQLVASQSGEGVCQTQLQYNTGHSNKPQLSLTRHPTHTSAANNSHCALQTSHNSITSRQPIKVLPISSGIQNLTSLGGPTSPKHQTNRRVDTNTHPNCLAEGGVLLKPFTGHRAWGSLNVWQFTSFKIPSHGFSRLQNQLKSKQIESSHFWAGVGGRDGRGQKAIRRLQKRLPMVTSHVTSDLCAAGSNNVTQVERGELKLADRMAGKPTESKYLSHFLGRVIAIREMCIVKYAQTRNNIPIRESILQKRNRRVSMQDRKVINPQTGSLLLDQ